MGRHLAAVLLAALPLGQGLPAAADSVPGSTGAATGWGCGLVLTTSVTLTEDLVCDGDGPLIGADDVTIDLNGHAVRGPGSGSGIGNTGYRRNTWKRLTVRDGRIEGFAEAIAFVGVSDSAITNVAVAGGRVGIEASSAVTISGTPEQCVLDGFVARGHAQLTIDHCTLRGDTSFYDSAVTLENSRLVAGHLHLGQSDNSVVTGNVFDGYPVSLGYQSRRNVFRDNVFSNAGVAVRTDGASPGATFENNTFQNNNVGINSYIFSETVTGNRFVGNRTAGIYIRDVISTSSITGNVFQSNGGAPSGLTDPSGTPVRGGVHIGSSQPETLTLTGNTGVDNAGYFIFARPGTVTDGGGNTGSPCGPSPNSAVTCH
ncbi:right-handed parallel beta-helix repeat-containing protein [Sphaerisporangium krabiense]|uniref:Parallel beta-helix repeat protein n=1 Tax=Sphaerisporangium krabiense TaxID=763782 RepID=A0A7W8YZR9_9ACTN|nr:right-handed parallel beta-helix repeat-containing protein [Sphaerisporangium krabiense]MBB5624822.1 parallel beta-helix repeat protein [Sphaerisporangium krabiense]